jgi:hypothetical protein
MLYELPRRRAAVTMTGGLFRHPLPGAVAMRVLSCLLLFGLALPLPAADRDHWAWRKPAQPAPPAVRDGAWPRNSVDHFILARLAAAGLAPAPEASRAVLIRRVTFDLIGLPPTPPEIDEFVHDPATDAYERLVERLLASPRYGERWGRHWLDVARFAESNGYEFDEVRPDAWRYRDYVIRAFNDDKPYDRFVLEQLAGDELFPDDPAALVATGFNLLGPDMTDASDQAQRRQNTLNDMTDTAGLAFLGLTLACARCHDHKFEPLPQRDYYRLQAFFTPAVFRRDLPIAGRAQRDVHARAQAEYAALVKPSQESLAHLEEPYRRRLYEAQFAKLADEARAAHETPAERRTVKQKELVEKTARLLVVSPQAVAAALSPADRTRRDELLAEIRSHDDRKPPPLPVAMGLQDGPGTAKTYVLERGELGQRGDEVQPGFPAVLGSHSNSARRAALAGWIASPDNPLTARVMVNRLWQHHFGRGLVGTPNDFGLRGERPSHPELLDWLASEFVARGWSLKSMHRLMLLSATYRQSASASQAARQVDPENRLLSHAQRVRLEGEVIRDSLLAVSGRLNQATGGPGVFPPVPAEAVQGTQGWKASAEPRDHVRRSVYVFARRNLRFPFLEAFDLPDSSLSCPKRERSTTATQALALLNAADVADAARALMERLTAEATTQEERVALAYRLALGRRPTATEMRLAGEFLLRSPLGELCRVLVNLNEFVYLD